VNPEIQCQLVRHAPLVAHVVVEFVGAHVSGPGNEEISNRAARISEQHACYCIAGSAGARRIIRKSRSEAEAPEGALARRAGGLADEALPNIHAELERVLSFLPAHVGHILEHVLAADEGFRARISEPYITRRADDRRGWLERIRRIAPRYFGPHGIGQFLR
jgi:hypothetical protein